jgi:hypothetical protein
MTSKRSQNAKFQIKEGQLVITIGLEGLKRSVECDTDLIVDDDVKAAFAIKSEISFEEEEGRTPFHSMIAAAAYSAYENGEEGFVDAADA